LAETAITAGKDDSRVADYQLVKALAEYRESKYGKAVEWSEKALDPSGTNYNRGVQAGAVLAMAQQRLGQTNEARTALAKAKQIAETKLPKPGSGDLGPDWQDWIISHTLLREAQDLIEAPSSAAEPAGAEKK
jgi:tetratricopeptide (TPR) repeat protein